jgi:hypothetical protein
MTQCSAHDLFEKLLQNSIDNLAEKIGEGVEALRLQSVENGNAIKLVLENQSAKRELCGKQGARIDALENSNNAQWGAITDLRRLVWMGAGGLVVVQLVITVGATFLARIVFR